MEELIRLKSFPVAVTLDILLKDRTTNKNIIWATNSYAENGWGCTTQITKDALLGDDPVPLRPRVSKALEMQKARTKSKAEVFTPSWICNKMNNYLDEEWFGRKDVFNTEGEKSWKANPDIIEFPVNKSWKEYIDSTQLEITCGEAPFIVSRYDTVTGIMIPIKERIGLLDRKLRIINENCSTEEEWMEWVYRAFQSVYGYEFQGDNLLIGRINILMTFVDYLEDRWNRKPGVKELKEIADIISWNFWQMDGLLDCVPFTAGKSESKRPRNNQPKENQGIFCKIMNWKSGEASLFHDCKTC